MDIFFNEYQLQNVFAWISLLEYQCGYPNLHGQLKTDIPKSWISILLSVEFWKSMYGYAMDSRTRAFTVSQIRGDLQGDLLFLLSRRGDVKIFYCDDDKMIGKPNFGVYGRIWLNFLLNCATHAFPKSMCTMHMSCLMCLMHTVCQRGELIHSL